MQKREENIRQFEIERARIEQEEKRKTIAAETKGHQERSKYQDQLARRRYDDQTAQQVTIVLILCAEFPLGQCL